MNLACVITFSLLVSIQAECDGQERFNIFMCKSHMCTTCTMAWCTKSCQKVQADFPTCRCSDWPDARTSYSGGKFAGKGKYGDVGDFAKEGKKFELFKESAMCAPDNLLAEIASGEIDNIDGCLKLCEDTPQCKFCSYDPTYNQCGLTATCGEIWNENTCSVYKMA